MRIGEQQPLVGQSLHVGAGYTAAAAAGCGVIVAKVVGHEQKDSTRDGGLPGSSIGAREEAERLAREEEARKQAEAQRLEEEQLKAEAELRQQRIQQLTTIVIIVAAVVEIGLCVIIPICLHKKRKKLEATESAELHQTPPTEADQPSEMESETTEENK